MVKYLVSFFFSFLLFSSISFAKDEDAKLIKEYGRDLTHAPFFIRNAFYNYYHKNWKDTYYSERESFLKYYDAKEAAEEAKEKAEAKEEAAKERQHLLDKKAAERQERDRLKAEIAEEKAEKEANAAEQRAFSDTISDQEKELRQMEQEISQQREDSNTNNR